MQDFMILAIIGRERPFVFYSRQMLTEDEWTESLTPISHPAISRCDKKHH